MIAARRNFRVLTLTLSLAALLGASGCSLWGGSPKPKPAELGPNVPVLGVRQAWTAKIGAMDGLALDVHVNANTLTLAAANGEVAAIDARTGGDVWRTQLNLPLAAGVGSDGRWAAVVSQGAQLIVLDGGREIWRKPLTAQAYTAPLVAGNRVFVLAA
ncbi:MAG TPA: PQQ-binding-like beta-propeller repeat protein, partial [Alicycliphilus sp.]|nr:PQQ-binding-like beta-propeller repeat protein [Alicycliphilus sp.]